MVSAWLRLFALRPSCRPGTSEIPGHQQSQLAKRIACPEDAETRTMINHLPCGRANPLKLSPLPIAGDDNPWNGTRTAPLVASGTRTTRCTSKPSPFAGHLA